MDQVFAFFQIIGSTWWGWALLLFLFGILVRKSWLNRPRYCPHDKTRMTRLAEIEKLKFLNEGQAREEGLKSRHYRVWRCDRCEEIKIHSSRVRSGFRQCKNCGHYCVHTKESIEHQATNYHSGEARDHLHCLQCDSKTNQKATLVKTGGDVLTDWLGKF